MVIIHEPGGSFLELFPQPHSKLTGEHPGGNIGLRFKVLEPNGGLKYQHHLLLAEWSWLSHLISL